MTKLSNKNEVLPGAIQSPQVEIIERGGQTLSEKAAARDAGLKPGERPGDAIIANQKMAVAEGFKNVADAWIKKTLPIADVLAKITEDTRACEDITLSNAAILRVNPDATITVDGAELILSEKATASLLEWAGLPVKTGPALLAAGDSLGREYFANIVNRGLGMNRPASGLMLRVRGNEIREIASDKFCAIDNAFLLELLAAVIPAGRISHLRYDGDTISGMVLIPDTIRAERDSEYGGTVHFRNSETRDSSLATMPAVFRAICCNGCIWGEEAGSLQTMRRHVGEIDYKVLATEIVGNITRSIPLANNHISAMLASREIRFTDNLSAIKLMCAMTKTLTQTERRAWVNGWVEEVRGGTEHDSVFGIIQGVTRAGRDTANESSALRLEKLGGALVGLDSSAWTKEFVFAKRITEDDAEKILGQELFARAYSL